MFLALREMRRAVVRFGLLMTAVALLVFLILFQQSLQNGLLTSFVGAIRNQSAPILVYSVDGQRTLQASAMTPELVELVRTTDTVARSGLIGEGAFTVEAGGEAVDATILGYEQEGLGSPAALTEGRLPRTAAEAVASDADAELGFGIGDVVSVEPGGYEITVVGLAAESQLNAGPTLFTDYPTFLESVAARNPDAGEPLPNVVAVEPASGASVEEVTAAINERSVDLDALSRSDAADLTPGVSTIRGSFQVIFLLYGLVVPLLTGLFFLIVTFQKAGALTLLRAIGAPAGRLVRSLLLQVVLIIGGGTALGVAFYAPVSQLRLGGIPLRFETAAVLGWAALLLALGVLSALVAVRRVLAIDPVRATTGAGVDL